MEKSFILSKESDFVKEYEKYRSCEKSQKIFIKNFLEEKEIETKIYHLGGNGFVNAPFGEVDKNKIRLGIEPTEKDIERFSKVLTKADKQNLCYFRANSAISKELADSCIKEQIIINLSTPYLSDYLKSLGYNSYNWSLFILDDTYYVKVVSGYLKNDDIPEGFTEIKLSEFYNAKEKFESKE